MSKWLSFSLLGNPCFNFVCFGPFGIFSYPPNYFALLILRFAKIFYVESASAALADTLMFQPVEMEHFRLMMWTVKLKFLSVVLELAFDFYVSGISYLVLPHPLVR